MLDHSQPAPTDERQRLGGRSSGAASRRHCLSLAAEPHAPWYTLAAVSRLSLLAALCLFAAACQKPLEARLQAGDAAARVGKWAAARDAWAEAVKLDPASSRAYAKLGVAHWQLGQRSDAAEAWSKAVQLDSAAEFALEGLARVDLAAGDAGAAVGRLEAVSAPGGSVRLALAQALLARGASDDAAAALAHAQAVAGLTPDDADALYLVGSAQIAMRRFSDAQGTLDTLQRRHPALALGSYGLARLAAAQSRQTDVILNLSAARASAGSSWNPDLVAADPAFSFISATPEFKALVGK